MARTWTRVRDKVTGHHYSVASVNPEKHVPLKQEAVDANGRPRPMKPRVEVTRSSQANANEPAATTKENDQ